MAQTFISHRASSNPTIQSIYIVNFTIGLESLKGQKVDGHVCLGCMVGKAQRNQLPGISIKAYEPMEQVHKDLVTATSR